MGTGRKLVFFIFWSTGFKIKPIFSSYIGIFELQKLLLFVRVISSNLCRIYLNSVEKKKKLELKENAGKCGEMIFQVKRYHFPWFVSWMLEFSNFLNNSEFSQFSSMNAGWIKCIEIYTILGKVVENWSKVNRDEFFWGPIQRISFSSDVWNILGIFQIFQEFQIA